MCCVASGVSLGLSPGVILCVIYSGGPSVSPGFSLSGSYYSCYAGETFCRAIAVGKFVGAFWWAILVSHFDGQIQRNSELNILVIKVK